MHMRRLLLLAAIPLLAGAGLGRASSGEYNVDIYAIDLAGNATNLTRNPAVDLSPAIARDGRIVFLSSRGQNGGDLYVMDRDGGNVRRLTNSAVDHSGVAWDDALDITQASWSPDGEEIAFDGLTGAGSPGCEQHCSTWRVIAVRSDGSGLRQIGVGARVPAWSPDGRRLAYESGIDAYFTAGGVTISRPDGSDSIRITAMNGDSDIGPVWSPRGGEVAYQARPAEAGRYWIYIVGPDGRRPRQITAGHNPAWSSNGRRLAFIDGYKLFTIGRDGKGKHRLSRKGEFVIAVAWSPKGGRVGYVAGTRAPAHGGLPTNLRVETVEASGKHVRVLVREPSESLIWGSPVWTPDGKRLLVALEPH
jgi:Tol biopolymer transport system component